MRGRGLNDAPGVPPLFWNQHKEHRQDAAADGKNAPHQSLPVRGDLWRVDGNRGWHILFAPHGDGLIFKVIHFAPAAENEERFVVGIAQKNPFQAVTVGVLKYRTQCIEAGLAKIFGTGEGTGAVLCQLRKHAAGIPFAIHAAGVSENGEPRDLVAESQRDVAIAVVAITIEPRGDSVDLELCGIRRAIRCPRLPHHN